MGPSASAGNAPQPVWGPDLGCNKHKGRPLPCSSAAQPASCAPGDMPARRRTTRDCGLVRGLARALRLTLVRLIGVGKTYRSLKGSDYTAVADFNLDIEAGEFFCLLGTSGCGKTTVLNMVAGFEPVTSGDIRITGTAIEGPGADRGGVFPGDDSLYSWLTALGNVDVGLRTPGVSPR